MKSRLCGLLLLLLCAARAAAQDVTPPTPTWPAIREIAFSGNDTTRPGTMLREMSVHVGDPADPAQVEHSRQAIQDLGLFKSVNVRQEPLPDGVRLVYVVREKFFLLPYPRLSGNVDRQYSYGAELRWNNIAGLNHSLRLLVSQSEPQRNGYGKQTSYSASYLAPFIRDTANDLELSADHVKAPMTDALTGNPYDEQFDSAEALLMHRFSTTAASQGWRVGGGALYQRENRSGPGAAPPYGHATALVGVLQYRDLHNQIYSEQGVIANLRHEVALRGALSDYGYSFFGADYARYLPVGEVQHQTLELSAAAGGYYSGQQEVSHFSLGGTSGLRAYSKYRYDGNAYYYGAALFQRPVGWPWLRAVGGLEVGNVADHAGTALFRSLHADLLLGLRVRVSWFVDLQFEAGWALPLNGSGAGRFYGGRL